MLRDIPAATHGKIITNEYFLAIRCEYDGCRCCSIQPFARIPVNIIPSTTGFNFLLPQPVDFNPQVYSQFNA